MHPWEQEGWSSSDANSWAIFFFFLALLQRLSLHWELLNNALVIHILFHPLYSFFFFLSKQWFGMCSHCEFQGDRAPYFVLTTAFLAPRPCLPSGTFPTSLLIVQESTGGQKNSRASSFLHSKPIAFSPCILNILIKRNLCRDQIAHLYVYKIAQDNWSKDGAPVPTPHLKRSVICQHVL